jgi:hypothetical protein
MTGIFVSTVSRVRICEPAENTFKLILKNHIQGNTIKTGAKGKINMNTMGVHIIKLHKN